MHWRAVAAPDVKLGPNHFVGPVTDGAGFAEGLDDRLVDLHARVHRGAYRAPPSRRVYIPKEDGGQRPLGIAALEDKVLQRAVTDTILVPIFETEFLGFSGTGMAIRLAHHYRIPALNLATLDVREAMDRLERIAETRHRRDVEQERALAGGTTDRKPSEAPRPPLDKSDKDWWYTDGERQVQEEQSRSVIRQRSMHL